MIKRTRQSYQKAQKEGLYAEWIVCWLLRVKGYRILKRRFKTHKGEIDIIARRGDTLIAMEVKKRATLTQAIESITAHQRKRIENALQVFLYLYPYYNNLTIRFDVTLICPTRWPKHLVNAWQPAGREL